MSEKTIFPTITEVSENIQTAITETLPLPVDSEPNTPPAVNRRNKYGLFSNPKYVFNEDGTVDYKKMVDPKFLYVNPDLRRRAKIESKYGKKFEEIKVADDKVDDADLVISLGGIKQLLKLRGYSSVHYSVNESSPQYASVNCSIFFIPNYESEGREIRFSDNACAHIDNTTNFGQKYLLEIATNRAFCRCVRNFLNINIVSQEELGGVSNGEASESPDDVALTLLKNTMQEYGVTFERVKAKLIEEKFPNAESFNEIKDLPKFKMFDLVGRIKRKAEELGK